MSAEPIFTSTRANSLPSSLSSLATRQWVSSLVSTRASSLEYMLDFANVVSRRHGSRRQELRDWRPRLCRQLRALRPLVSPASACIPHSVELAVLFANVELPTHSFYCRRGEALLCEDFSAHGVLNLDGGFAEYVSRGFDRGVSIRGG